MLSAGRSAMLISCILFWGGPDIVSCPGTAYCSHALVNTNAAENMLRRLLPGEEKRAVRISGCPNGCAHSAVAPIGFIGKIRKDSTGRPLEGFQVVYGGGIGQTPLLAEAGEAFIPAEDINKIFDLSFQHGPSEK